MKQADGGRCTSRQNPPPLGEIEVEVVAMILVGVWAQHGRERRTCLPMNTFEKSLFRALSGSPTVRGMSARWFGRKLLWGEQTKKMTQGGSETQVGSAFGQPTLLSRCEWELASATWSALPMEVGSNAPHLSACARRGIAKRSRRIRLPPVARGHLRIGIAFRQSRRRSAGSARRAARLASQPSPLRTPRLAGSRP